jgi:hypothetical protein
MTHRKPPHFNPSKMAPKLSKIQRTELENVIISKLQGIEVMTDKEIANTVVPCTTRAIRTARAKILKNGRIDGNRKTGRPREVTEHMWLALQSQLEQNPCMSQQDMVNFLCKKDATITISRFTIGRELKRRNWTKKVVQKIAKEQKSGPT